VTRVEQPSALPVAAAVAGRPRVSLAIGALLISASAILIDRAATSPATASFFRSLLALPLLLLVALVERRRLGNPTRQQVVTAVVAGVLLAGDVLLWTQAIYEVGAGVATVLVNIQVVIVPLLALAVDREPVSRRFVGALPFACAGVVLAGGVLEHGVGGPHALRGTIEAVLAALSYSGFLFLLRRSGRRGPIVQPYMIVTVSSALASLVVGPFWRGVDLHPPAASLGWLALTALSGGVLGWLLIATATPRLDSHVGAVLLLLTPVGSLALAAAILGERPTPLQLAGSALILTSAYAVAADRGPRRLAPSSRG
jgi:drug/metabolite transporter (DMT)-like permease